MSTMEFFGAAPTYGELYYNLHAETGRCLNELEHRISADRRSPVLLVSDEPILSRKVALSALKLRAVQQPKQRTNVVWLDLYRHMSLATFWEAATAAVVELWLSLDSTNMSYFERRLISTGAFVEQNSGSGPPPEFARILNQMSGAEIVIVIDVRHSSKELVDLLTSVLKGFDALLAEHSNNCLALLVLAAPPLTAGRYLRALGTAFIPITLGEREVADLLDLLQTPRVIEAGFAQMAARPRRPPSRGDPIASTASSLVLVGQPILVSAARYLASVSADGTESIDALVEEGAVERLWNSGLALTNVGSERYGELEQGSPIDVSRAIIEANSAHLLSALRPRDLHPFDNASGLAERALGLNNSLVEHVGACVAARVARSSTLAGYLGDRLAEILQSRAMDWAPLDGDLLDDVLKYLSLVAFREPDLFDRGLFKLTEEMTYALNAFSLANDPDGSQYLRAQRITRLTHLYDKAPKDVRQRIGITDTRRFARQALEILETDRRPPHVSLDVQASYLSGWLHQDVGDSPGARKCLIEAALISKHAQHEKDQSLATISDTSLAFELATQAIFFSNEPLEAAERNLVAEMLATHGIVTSLQEMLNLAESGIPGRKAIPKDGPVEASYWHIIFNRRDFGVGIMIASALLFEWRQPVEIICVPDNSHVGGILDQCRGRPIVLGGPDSPGPIGDYIQEALPNISKLWQLRFNESFYQPVLIQGLSDRPPTVVLVTSIAGDGLLAWGKFVLESGIPTQGERGPMDFALLGSILPTVLTTGSKKLTELFIDRVVKAVETKIDPKARQGADEDLAGVKRVLVGATNSNSPQEAQRRLSEGLNSALRSRLVLTGIIEATDDGALYAQIEGLLTELTLLEGSTNHYRDMAALLRVLSLHEHRKSGASLERARKARNFADGFSNLNSRLNALIEDYETKAKWDVAAQNEAVNDLITTGSRFLQFARSLA